MTTPALLAARDLRVDIDGAIAVEATTFTTRGASAAVLGAGEGLLLALAGLAAVRSGSLNLLDHDVERRAHLRSDVLGVAPLDPPLPPQWTVREYLTWGARLALAGRAAAREHARRTLAELGLEPLQGARLDGLPLHERRAVVIAEAAVMAPSVLVASAPLSGLGGREAAYVTGVLLAATRGRFWIASVANPYAGSAESALATAADEVLLFASGRLVRQGKLERIEEGATGYTLLLRGGVEEFRQALRGRGVELLGGPQRFFVHLPPEIRADDLLALSVETGTPIVELVPRILPSP